MAIAGDTRHPTTPETPPEIGRKKKAGPPQGNVSGIKHAGRSTRQRFGLVHAKLGRRFAAAYGHCNQLRREVERLVRQHHGGISLSQQARIQSLLRCEESCRALELMIRDKADTIAADELRLHRHHIVQWSCQRDKILGELLGDLPADGKADVYAFYHEPEPPTSQPPTADAPAGQGDA